ncbi:MAG: hypothetical protein ACM3KI_11145 [Bacillota bacterium]
MEDQLELMPLTKHIPQWISNYFYQANCGNYVGKQYFYEKIKPFVLNSFGEFVGYDLQIIKQQCYSCDGTGVYKKYHYEYGQRFLVKKEACIRCNGGIYMTKRFSLARYVLNGKIYHIPHFFESNRNHINTIEGVINHESINHDEAFRAYLIFLWKYDKAAFYSRLKEMAQTKLKWIPEFIQSLIKKDNINDELPF